ncbi:helix-turn-helix domain-containing protein [Paenibacillus athensensis]|uniref:AraC family transcriptional regulator n=1 Tax=Paenibacillus athensensis TaxID=1967502 RepID=A0A4Y8QAL9_9BACL|nr:AraC family transcriptional regulator [Paenibacillus athensensis]
MAERYPEIDALIDYIQHNIYEPLPLAHLASFAGYSQYHFARIFKERIGLSPLYYVSAMRLQKAKDLLLQTNLNIRDIGLEIGQQSLGTFTTRFKERVGVSPAEFRQSAQQADRHLSALQKLTRWQTPQQRSPLCGIVTGTLHAAAPFEGVVLVGLFAKPIPEGFPLYGTLVSSLDSFAFTNVKPGIYYLMATSISWGSKALDVLLPQTTLRTRSKEPIVVASGHPVPPLRVELFEPRADDPPILISLPLLMNNFLRRMRE